MLLRGTMSKPLLVRAWCCTRRGTRAGILTNGRPRFLRNMPLAHCKSDIDGLNRSIEEPKANPTAVHSRRSPHHTWRCQTAHLGTGRPQANSICDCKTDRSRNHWPCKDSRSNSCKREDMHMLGDNLRKLRRYLQCFWAVLFRSALVRG
jgi:hypothetical protein